MLPFSYAARNLFRSRARLMQTIGGSALVVLLVMTAVAINNGMNRVLSASGSEHNVILLGVGSEESVQRSEVADRTAEIAASSVPGISKRLGVPAVSSEIHFMTHLDLAKGLRAQALIRGVTPTALRVHPNVRLVDGSFPQAGQVMLGRLAWKKLGIGKNELRVGSTVGIHGQNFQISGVFAAPGTVMESEIWAVISDLRVLAQRESISCVVMRFDAPEDVAEADLFAKQRLDLELSAIRESDYYDKVREFFGPLRTMVWITAALIAAGALFGGINTLYAAFASRVREIGTLQAIGFGRATIVMSLVQESTLACMMGTLAASAAALILLDGRIAAFSIGAFRMEITPDVAAAGVTTGFFLGILGALPAAWRCLRPPLPSALRMS